MGQCLKSFRIIWKMINISRKLQVVIFVSVCSFRSISYKEGPPCIILKGKGVFFKGIFSG